MFALLNWRVLLLAALVCALSLTHFAAYRKGKANVRTEWQAATAAANLESFKASERRQRNADQAAKSAGARVAGIRVDSARAGDALERLRSAINARDLAEQSIAAANQRADTLGELLQSCGKEYQELARAADGHASDVRLLLDAWPR